MSETHDIFLRALAFPNKEKEEDRDKRKRRRRARTNAGHKWPKWALVFDTETKITADQSLTFGVYRLCQLVGENYIESIKAEIELATPPRRQRIFEAIALAALGSIPWVGGVIAAASAAVGKYREGEAQAQRTGAARRFFARRPFPYVD